MNTSTQGSSRRSRKREPTDNNTAEMPDWARDLEGLWSNEEPNLEAEIRYNTKVSMVPPYCAICSLFAQESDKKTDPKNAKKPKYSKPLISDKMFSSNVGRLSSAGFTPAIDVEGRSPLVTCTSCAVCVHASCYGLQYDEDYSQWKCSKCAQKQCTASCWLCHLRGGALKRTTTGHWCHIVCALGVPEVAFESVVHRSPISVTRVPAGRMKMKCEFCYAWTSGSDTTGVCIQCCDGVCTTAFHVSCAQAYGIKFSPAEWPFPVDAICHKHNDSKENAKKKSAKESFPVAKLSPRKSVSAGPRSSSYSPVRQLRKSGSATNIPDISEQKDEDEDDKMSVDSNSSKVMGKLSSDKSKHPIVCLKFLSDTEVKRLSSPSSSPMAKAKVEEESMNTGDTKSPTVRRRMGPLSKTQGKKRQASLDRNQASSASSFDFDVSQETATTSSSSLPGSSSSAVVTNSVSASPKSNAKLSKTGKANSSKSPDKQPRRRLSKDTEILDLPSLEKKASVNHTTDESQESLHVSLSNSAVESDNKKPLKKKSQSLKDNNVKSKQLAHNEAGSCKNSDNSQVAKTPGTSKSKNISKKLPVSPKSGKTVGDKSVGEGQTAKRMVSPKRANKLSPKSSPVKLSPKSNAAKSSPVKSSPVKSNSVKSSPVKSPKSPKKASPNKKNTSPSKVAAAKLPGSVNSGVTPSPTVIKKILSDSASGKKTHCEPVDGKTASSGVINQNTPCELPNVSKLSDVSTSSPAIMTSFLESKLMNLPAENNFVPLPTTQPLACSTPVQDISEAGKDQQSPVTSRSRSGRAIKISSVAREAFMDSSEENNFGFLMGLQAGEISPDAIKPPSFPEEPKEDMPPKKLHWKTLQKMERLRQEQEGGGAKGPPLYVPKTMTPKLPHNNDHIQAVIDMVVENARISVDKEDGNPHRTKTTGMKVDGAVPGPSWSRENSMSASVASKPSRFSFGKQDVDTRENGFVAKSSPAGVNVRPISSHTGDSRDGFNAKLSNLITKTTTKETELPSEDVAPSSSSAEATLNNKKLTDLIAKMATRVTELPPEDVPPSSSSAETTPNKSFLSASSKRTDEGSSDSEEDSSDSEDDSASASSPEKSVCSQSKSPRVTVDDTASASAQDIDYWYKGEVQIDGLEDDNNNEAINKLEDNLDELESSRDSFDYVNSVSNAANADSAEEPEANVEPVLSKVEENNRLLKRGENPYTDDNKKNAFFSAELEKYLLNVSPVKQGEFLGSKNSSKSKVEFKKGTNTGWKTSMEPDIDEVEGVIFFSFSCKEALENHVKKEKSSVGKPRQVSSSLAKYHAKIQQEAAVSGMGLYPRGSCKSLVKHLAGHQLETLGLDLPRQACRLPDFSRESEWRQVNSGAYDAMEDCVMDVEDTGTMSELTSPGSSSFDVNVTRIYGRKSDGTFARKKMALPRLKRQGPALPVNIEGPPGLDKYESQSKEWGIVTTQIIQQRARELKQEGFTFPRIKPLVSYQPVTVTSSMALAAAAALQLVPTTPREPTDTACKRPGCRYGCVCHLCESVPSVEEEDEGAQSDQNSTQSNSCPKQYCRLGCICDSIDENASSPRTPTHCGKPSCMFECICEKIMKEETLETKVKIEDPLEPGEVRIMEQPGGEGMKVRIGAIPDSDDKESMKTESKGSSKEITRENTRTFPTRGRGRGSRRGMGRGRGGQRNPPVSSVSSDPAASDDATTVRKSSRLKNKPLIGIGNIDRLNSLVFFDTVAWLAEGDGPRKRKKTKDSEGNITTDAQGNDTGRRLSTGSKGRERIGSNSSNNAELIDYFQQKYARVKTTEMDDGDAMDEGSDDAMEDEENGPSTCARAYVYKRKQRKRRLSEKPIKFEVKEESADVKLVTDSPEPKSIKIKTEKISPVAKNLSPASRQSMDGLLGDYVHPLMGKFKTQMVLLQRKRSEQANLEALAQDTPYLLEIQSNCDWEGIRSQLLSKISTEMNLISANAQYEYPNLTSFKIGSFIADILPRPEKATTIPPNLQRILGTKDMYPIRIRIIHTSCHLGKRDEAGPASPVGKQIEPDEKPIASPEPKVVPAKVSKSRSEETKASLTVGGLTTRTVDFGDQKKPENSKSSFVGLSGLSRLNLKIDGYSGPAGPSMSFLTAPSANSETSGVKHSSSSPLAKKLSVDHTPRHPHRTPTPPGMTNTSETMSQRVAEVQSSEKTGEKSLGTEKSDKIEGSSKDSFPIGQVIFIPLTSTMNLSSMNLTSGEMSSIPLSNNLSSNTAGLANISGASPKLQAALAAPPMFPGSQISTITSQPSNTLDNIPLPVRAQSNCSNQDSSNSQPDDKQSSLVNDSKVKTTKADADQTISSAGKEPVKYVPAGFLVVPGQGPASVSQGSLALSVKALVVGPQNVVASTRLPAGTNLKSLPPSFRLTPVVSKMDIPIKNTDGKICLNKGPAVAGNAPEKTVPLKPANEKLPSPLAKVKSASAGALSDVNGPKAPASESTEVATKPKEVQNQVPDLEESAICAEKDKPAQATGKSQDASNCKAGSGAGVPITINCSIQSGSVKYTEVSPDGPVLSGRGSTPDSLEVDDDVDDDLLSIDDDESDSVDVEFGDGENILLALRKQHQSESSSNRKQKHERRSSTPHDGDSKKKASGTYPSRQLATHCSRYSCPQLLDWTKPRERKRRYQIGKLFKNLQTVYECMYNVSTANGIPVAKYRLLQFATNAIAFLEEREKKLAVMRAAEAKKRLHLMTRLLELQKSSGLPISTPPNIPKVVGSFQHESWYENRMKKAEKDAVKDDEDDLEDDQPAAFHFRPIEEVVPEKSSGKTSNSSKGHRGKKSKKRSKDPSEKSQSSFRNNIPKITQTGRRGDDMPQVYIDYDDGYLYDDQDSRSQDRSSLHQSDVGAETPKRNQVGVGRDIDKPEKKMTEKSSFRFDENPKETENLYSDLVGDHKLGARKRKLSRSDGDSPQAKESKL